jgi:hypothetical protein
MRHGLPVTASYHINREDEFVSLRLTGAVDLVEIYELCQSFLDDPHFSRTWPHLVDLRGLDIDVKPGAMRPFSQFLLTKYRPEFSAAPMAIVMDADRDSEFSAGLYRFTCGLGNAELFDDYAQAVRWLIRNGWGKEGRPAPASLEQPDSRRNGADEGPEQIRA